MNDISVDIDTFYTYFPEFNTDDYAVIAPAALYRAKVYISLHNWGRLKDDKRELALYLMTAHLATLMYKNGTGDTSSTSGRVASAAVGEVNVSYEAIPTADDEFEYWLSLTPYGLELLALLSVLTSAPFYIGGSYERVF